MRFDSMKSVRVFVSDINSKVINIHSVNDPQSLIRLPGGQVDLGEITEFAACRILHSQTGFHAVPQDLIKIHKDEKHSISFFYAPRAFGPIRVVDKNFQPSFCSWSDLIDSDKCKEYTINKDFYESLSKKFPSFNF